MKIVAVVAVLGLFLHFVAAQERVPRGDAVKIANLVNFDLAKLADTPIPTDADTKRPFALREGQFGGLVVPEAKLAAGTLAGAGREAVPVGQLWLHNLAPLREGQVTPNDKLKLVPLIYMEKEQQAVLCVLGARKAAGGGLELLVYGKGKEPLLVVPLKKVEGKQEWPLEFAAEKEGNDTARITLKILGQYEAEFRVTEQEP